MDDLTRERDFYRQQCNELGSRLLRLQEEQTRAWRHARRSHATAKLIRELYRQIDSQVSLDEIGQQFLQIMLDTLSVDRTALLSYLPESGCFVAQHAFGFQPAALSSFIPPVLPDGYHFVNSYTDAEPLIDCLRQVAGVPYLLWSFDIETGLALLVGNATEDQHLHHPFEAADREIIDSALSVFIELTERKQAENLAAISRLALQLAGAAPDVDLLELLAEELRTITGALITSVSIYNPKTEELAIKHIASSGQILSTLNKLVGRPVTKMRIPVSAELRQLMSAEVVGTLSDLSDVTFGSIPKPVASGVQKVLGIGEIRGLALQDGDNLLGTALIAMPEGRSPLPMDVLKIFAHVAAVALQRKKAEERIKASLKEKEVLLQEIHHRVKNNMQVVSSLLNLQTGGIQDQQILEILRDSQNRIRSMALVHDKLYQSHDLARIDFADYVRDLTEYLFHSYRANARAITLRIEIDEVFLDIDAAVPAGLIINELVSNAFKHAFPDGQSGETRIALQTEANHQFVLIVGDNGVGFPSELDFRETESLGLQLVNTLVDQLDGTIELRQTIGAEFKIVFNGS